MTQAQDLANEYMLGARLNYSPKLSLQVIVALQGGETELIIGLDRECPTFPSDLMVLVTAMFTSVVDTPYLVTVNECWMKGDITREREKEMQRGDLQRLAEQGDASVHTSLVVQAIDCQNFEESVIKTYDVEADEEHQHRVGTDDNPEFVGLPHRIYGAYRAGRIASEQKLMDGWQAVAAYAAGRGYITTVAVRHEGDD